MKKSILCLFISLSANYAHASMMMDSLLDSIQPKPDDGRHGKYYPDITDSKEYEVKDGQTVTVGGVKYKFTGRNENITSNSGIMPLEDEMTGGITRVVAPRVAKNKAKFENLESATGEMVVKVESDKNNQAEKLTSVVKDSRKVLTDAYYLAKEINLENIGKEQDPTVQHPFKCADIENCNSNNIKDLHAVEECKESEMLNWTGKKWGCFGVFEKVAYQGCSGSDYYEETTASGDKACLKFIYQWDILDWSPCENNLQNAEYSCFKKKGPKDKGVEVADSSCSFLGDKPTANRACSDDSGNVEYGTWDRLGDSYAGSPKFVKGDPYSVCIVGTKITQVIPLAGDNKLNQDWICKKATK